MAVCVGIGAASSANRCARSVLYCCTMSSVAFLARLRWYLASTPCIAASSSSVMAIAAFSLLLAFDDLKKAVTAHADVSNRVRMHRRFAFRHQNPFLALEMRRQPGGGHRGQAQGSIGCSAIDVVGDLVGHQMRIARQPLAAIASVA